MCIHDNLVQQIDHLFLHISLGRISSSFLLCNKVSYLDLHSNCLKMGWYGILLSSFGQLQSSFNHTLSLHLLVLEYIWWNRSATSFHKSKVSKHKLLHGDMNFAVEFSMESKSLLSTYLILLKLLLSLKGGLWQLALPVVRIIAPEDVPSPHWVLVHTLTHSLTPCWTCTMMTWRRRSAVWRRRSMMRTCRHCCDEHLQVG